MHQRQQDGNEDGGEQPHSRRLGDEGVTAGGKGRAPRPEGDTIGNANANGRPRHEGRRPNGAGKPAFEGASAFEVNPRSGGKDFERGQQRPPRDRREPAFDPDSPWAALAALRNPKSE